MQLSSAIVDLYLLSDWPFDMQIWTLLARSQCRVSLHDAQVTIKTHGPLVCLAFYCAIISPIYVSCCLLSCDDWLACSSYEHSEMSYNESGGARWHPCLLADNTEDGNVLLHRHHNQKSFRYMKLKIVGRISDPGLLQLFENFFWRL